MNAFYRLFAPARDKGIIFGGLDRLESLKGSADVWIMYVLADNKLEFHKTPTGGLLPYWGGVAMLHPR